jgi:hypothetical protein
MTAFQSMMLLSCGAPLIPAGGSCCRRLKSRISRFLAGVDISAAAARRLKPYLRVSISGRTIAVHPPSGSLTPRGCVWNQRTLEGRRRQRMERKEGVMGGWNVSARGKGFTGGKGVVEAATPTRAVGLLSPRPSFISTPEPLTRGPQRL